MPSGPNTILRFIAVRPTPRLMLVADYLRYSCSKTKGFGNRLNFKRVLMRAAHNSWTKSPACGQVP